MKYKKIGEKIKKVFSKIIFSKTLKWTVIVVVGLYVLLVLIRVPHAIDTEKTLEQVEKIHATKLTLADVMGDNLPPDPGDKADLTVEGIDANSNGIRDDVELAIFKEYPKSAKVRAVLLQYALALQMQMIQPIVNQETVIAVAQQQSRASRCIGSSESRDDMEKFIKIVFGYNDFVEDKQIDTEVREKVELDFFKHIGSYSDMEGEYCDIKLDELPN